MREFERALPVDVEVTGRVVEGIALRWDRPYRVSDDGGETFYNEGWRRRAFERGLRATGNFHEVRIDHRDTRVGRASFAESAEGLPFTATMDETPGGDRAIEYARAGKFGGVSLRFESDRQEFDQEHRTVWRTRAVARELSFVDQGVPQYADASITRVRAVLWVAEADPEVLHLAADVADLLARSQRNLGAELPPLVNG